MIMRSLDWKVHWYCGDLGDIESLVEELRLPSHKKYSPLKVFFLWIWDGFTSVAFHYHSFEGIVISLSKFANNQNDDASFCCPSQWIWNYLFGFIKFWPPRFQIYDAQYLQIIPTIALSVLMVILLVTNFLLCAYKSSMKCFACVLLKAAQLQCLGVWRSTSAVCHLH